MLIPRTLTFITNPKNQILLIRNSPNKHTWPNLYNAIGGHIEPGETISEGARREIVEETGITDIEALALCGIITITIETPSSPVLLFLFSAQTNQETIVASSEGTPQWIPLSSLANLPLVPDLPDLLSRVFDVTNKNHSPFFGNYTMLPDNTIRSRFT